MTTRGASTQSVHGLHHIDCETRAIERPLVLNTAFAFHPRCPRAVERCRHEMPVLRALQGGEHWAACHLAPGGALVAGVSLSCCVARADLAPASELVVRPPAAAGLGPTLTVSAFRSILKASTVGLSTGESRREGDRPGTPG